MRGTPKPDSKSGLLNRISFYSVCQPEWNPHLSAGLHGIQRIPWQHLGTVHRTEHPHPAVSTVHILSQTEEAVVQLNQLDGR